MQTSTRTQNLASRTTPPHSSLDCLELMKGHTVGCPASLVNKNINCFHSGYLHSSFTHSKCWGITTTDWSFAFKKTVITASNASALPAYVHQPWRKNKEYPSSILELTVLICPKSITCHLNCAFTLFKVKGKKWMSGLEIKSSALQNKMKCLFQHH